MSTEDMKKRLERVKARPWRAPTPLTSDELNSEPGRKLLTPESVYMRRVEKIMREYDTIKGRMLKDTHNYLSMYHELKNAEKAFFAALSEEDVQFLELPSAFWNKVEQMKNKMLRKKG